MLVSVTAGDVMQRPVITAAPDESIGTVAARLADNDVGSIVVVSENRPVGIVTESTILDCYRADRDLETTVEDVMATPVHTIDHDATIEAVARRMRDAEISTLPVCGADGELTGIITTTDLSNYLPRMEFRGVPAHDRSTHQRSGRPDTAYERDDWRFESYGENDAVIDVGDVVTFEKVLSADDVAAFAEASGDTNRLHLDVAYAERSRFGRSIAHGTLVAGLISAALARLPGLIIYLSQETTYVGPVDVDRTARAECEVVESLGADRYRLQTAVFTGEEKVIEGEATVLADEIPAAA